MRRNEGIERRLLNWARWRQGAGMGGLGYSSVNLQAESARDAYRESVIPTSACEAEETDQAVRALPEALGKAVQVHYLSSRGVPWQAQRLGIVERTLRERIAQAHHKIQGWLYDREAARKAQRQRVEALQRASRPGLQACK